MNNPFQENGVPQDQNKTNPNPSIPQTQPSSQIPFPTTQERNINPPPSSSYSPETFLIDIPEKDENKGTSEEGRQNPETRIPQDQDTKVFPIYSTTSIPDSNPLLNKMPNSLNSREAHIYGKLDREKNTTQRLPVRSLSSGNLKKYDLTEQEKENQENSNLMLEPDKQSTSAKSEANEVEESVPLLKSADRKFLALLFSPMEVEAQDKKPKPKKKACKCCHCRKRKQTNVKKDKKQSACSQKRKALFEKYKKPIPPDCKFRQIWDVILMAIIIASLIVIPLQISFNVLQSLFAAQVIFDAFFIFDILLTFHTGYYENGILVTDHRRIARRYARSWLIVDIIVAIPFFSLNFAENGNFDYSQGRASSIVLLNLLRLLKIIRAIKFFKVNHIFKKIKSYYGASSIIVHILQIIKLLVVALLVANWLGCGFHWVAVIEIEDGNGESTWIYQKGLEDDDTATQYLYSLYWAVTTMLTVGYGDVTPTTPAEVAYVTTSMFIGVAVFAYALGSINSIIQSINLDYDNMNYNIYAANRFMMRNNINEDVQKKIRRYIEHMAEEERTKKQYSEQLLELLPEVLKRELLMDLRGHILLNNQIFRNSFSIKLLKEAAAVLTESTFCPEEFIINETLGEEEVSGENDNDTQSLYFVIKGKVVTILQKTNVVLKIFGVHEAFGVPEFFSGMKEGLSIKSVGYSLALCLKRSAFLNLLQDYSEDKEMFSQIKDTINLYRDYSPLQIRCFVCMLEDHILHKCPQLHCVFNKDLIIKKASRGTKACPSKFDRKRYRPFHALLQKKGTNEIVFQVRRILLNMENPQEEESMSSIQVEDESILLELPSVLVTEGNEQVKHPTIDLRSSLSDVRSQVDKEATQREKEDKYILDLVESRLTESLEREREDEESTFERVCIFTKYFPHNNVDNVITRINRINELKAGGQVNNDRENYHSLSH